MSETDHIEPSSATPAVCTVDDLASEIETIKTEISRLRRNRLAKIATVLAAIGAVISAINGYFTSRDNFVKAAKTSLTRGPTLEFIYDPGKNELMTIRFTFLLENLGNADDTVLSAYSRVAEPSGEPFAPLSGFRCTTDASALKPSPFTVPKAAITKTTCEVEAALGSLSRPVFSNSGAKQFLVAMQRRSGKDLKLAACFHLDPDAAQDISNKKPVRRQIQVGECS